MKRPVYKGYKA